MIGTIQETYGEARKYGPLLDHIWGCWQGIKLYLPIGWSKYYYQIVENNFAQKIIESLSYMVMNEVGERT